MAGAGCPCPDSLGGASKDRRDAPGTAEAAQGTEFWQPGTQPYNNQGKPSLELQNRTSLIEVDTYIENRTVRTEPGATKAQHPFKHSQ